MSCSEIDWKAYVLDEMSAGDRLRAHEHAEACAACGEELERLQLTRAALLAVADEEIPRRIAFVSDKVFEPGWWQRLWTSAPRLGFASAAMLSIAILVSALTRPGPAPVGPPVQPDRAQVASLVEQELQRCLPVAVKAAVSTALVEADRRNEVKTRQLLAATEQRLEFDHRAEMLAVSDRLTILNRQLKKAYMANNGPAEEDHQ